MTEQEYLELAKEFAAKEGCDIVRAAGEEDGWHYFIFTLSSLPRYSGIPRTMRIDTKGRIEEIQDAHVCMAAWSRSMVGLRRNLDK